MSDVTPPIPALPQKPKRSRTSWFVGIGVGFVVVVAAIVLVVVNLTAQGAATAKAITVKVGVTDASSPYWQILKRAAMKEGIDVQTVNFRDYTQPNAALADGQVDLNLFQHLQFLANYDVQSGQNLVPIGSTYIVPLSLYSKKHDSASSIPQGAKVAIPNDPTNQARALLVLQKAGLLKLTGGGNTLATPADIVPAQSRVSVIPVDATQTAPALDSADASVVNNTFALPAGLDPSKALFNDDPKSATAAPYINVVVARAKDKDNATYQKIAELYHTKAVTDAVLAESKNTAVIVQRPESDLVGILDGLKKTIQAAK